MVGFWAITRSMKKARDAGFRFWAINPLAVLHSILSREFLVFLVSDAVMAAAVFAGFALQPYE